jgi:hypothetical protein
MKQVLTSRLSFAIFKTDLISINLHNLCALKGAKSSGEAQKEAEGKK